METRFRDYCTSIDMSTVQIERVDRVIEEYSKILIEPIKSIFVGEQLNNEGIRIYLSLWVFTETYICEAKSFLSEDDFDFTYLKDTGKYLKITKSEYEFGSKPSPKSSLTILYTLRTELQCLLKSSGNNCATLEKIIKDYLLPNIK